MNGDTIKEIIDKIPASLILVIYLGYLGFGYYNFENDSQSELGTKNSEIHAAKANEVKLRKKINEANQFLKTLDAKKEEIRSAMLELQNMKEVLSEKSDVPAFMKMLIIEAKRMGVSVVALKPNGSQDKEFYSESTFQMSIQGVFVQVISFLDRISNVSEIVKIDMIELSPVASSQQQYVVLNGKIDLKTYKYRGSVADSVGKSDKNNTPLIPIDSNTESKGLQQVGS